MKKLTKEEFIELLKTKNMFDSYTIHKRFEDNKKVYVVDSVSWVSGGITGGSCWGGEPNVPVESEREPELERLDDFLLELVPDISFLVHKKIMREIERSDYSYSEYYGNYTTYGSKYLTVDKFYDVFCDHIFEK